MDERVRRRWAATEAMALGWGGISAVAVATGMARNTVASGVRELAYSLPRVLKACYNKFVDMQASWFGALYRNSNWNQYGRFFNPGA
jgi:hypothetical protein